MPELYNQLRDLGYSKLDLESLVASIPRTIWVTMSEKNIKREEANLVITRKDSKWSVSLTVTNNDNGELYIIHQIIDLSLKNAIARMILFLHESKLMGANI